MIDTLENEIRVLNEYMTDLRNQLNAKSRELFKEQCKRVFVDFPFIENFSWVQYTPYFNDGDECIFRVNSDDVKINGIDSWDTRSYDASLRQYVYDPEYAGWEAAFNDLARLVGGIDEDVMRDMFNDHVEITVFPDRIEVEEYAHE